MFGFLGEAFSEIGANIGNGISYALSSQDSYEDDEYEQRQRAKRRARENEKSSINESIESFKTDSIKMIKNKYKENITFVGEKLKVEQSLASNSHTIKKHLDTLKLENDKITKLVKELEEAKNAI